MGEPCPESGGPAGAFGEGIPGGTALIRSRAVGGLPGSGISRVLCPFSPRPSPSRSSRRRCAAAPVHFPPSVRPLPSSPSRRHRPAPVRLPPAPPVRRRPAVAGSGPRPGCPGRAWGPLAVTRLWAGTLTDSAPASSRSLWASPEFPGRHSLVSRNVGGQRTSKTRRPWASPEPPGPPGRIWSPLVVLDCPRNVGRVGHCAGSNLRSSLAREARSTRGISSQARNFHGPGLGLRSSSL